MTAAATPAPDASRAFVGPPERWDTMAAMQFTVLANHGLREKHRLCDVGCGSLRAGRLFIPYLLSGHYYGIEPETWLVVTGISLHVGSDLKRMREPTFITDRHDFPIGEFGVKFDYILAQSILTHTDQEQARLFLANAAASLAPGGKILATYVRAGADFAGSGWTYPGMVEYTRGFMREAGAAAGLSNFDEEVVTMPYLRSRWAVWS